MPNERQQSIERAGKGRGRSSAGSEILFIIEEGNPILEKFLSLRNGAGMNPRSLQGAIKGLGRKFSQLSSDWSNQKKSWAWDELSAMEGLFS